MKTPRCLFAATAAAALMLTIAAPKAVALEAYSPAQQQQFVDWCTGAKSAKETTCTCALKSLAQSVPAAALATFLSSQGSFNLSTAAISTGTAVTNALLSCSQQ